VTTRPDHAAEARRLLTLVRPTALTQAELPEFYAYETPANIVAAANVHATLALVEEQRTANLIAADRLDTILSPHGIGGEEYNAFWAKHAGNITQRLGMNA
jgi:hypothetical protein